MSEVDRLSNSGLYPTLPMADKRDSKHEPPDRPPSGAGAARPGPKHAEEPLPEAPRSPKSLIDEYA
jgi:hypothetical protein